MSIEIVNGPILHWKKRKQITQIRKFKSLCGSTVEIGLNRVGQPVQTKSDHLHCKAGCIQCKNKIENALKIIHKTA